MSSVNVILNTQILMKQNKKHKMKHTYRNELELMLFPVK